MNKIFELIKTTDNKVLKLSHLMKASKLMYNNLEQTATFDSIYDYIQLINENVQTLIQHKQENKKEKSLRSIYSTKSLSSSRKKHKGSNAEVIKDGIPKSYIRQILNAYNKNTKSAKNLRYASPIN